MKNPVKLSDMAFKKYLKPEFIKNNINLKKLNLPVDEDSRAAAAAAGF